MVFPNKDFEVTGVSRCGRVRKKPSKLLDFESDDLHENKFKKQKQQQQQHAYELLQKFEREQQLQKQQKTITHAGLQTKSTYHQQHDPQRPQQISQPVQQQRKSNISQHHQSKPQQISQPSQQQKQLHITPHQHQRRQSFQTSVSNTIVQNKQIKQEYGDSSTSENEDEESTESEEDHEEQRGQSLTANNVVKTEYMSANDDQEDFDEGDEKFEDEDDDDDDDDEDDDNYNDDDDDDEQEENIEQDPLMIKESDVHSGFQKLEPPKVDASKSLYMAEKYNRRLTIKDGKVISNKSTKIQRKDKGKSRYTAYMLWAKDARQNLIDSNPTLDFGTVSKSLGELWATVPHLEKCNWKRRAKRLNSQGSVLATASDDKMSNQSSNKSFINKTSNAPATKNNFENQSLGNQIHLNKMTNNSTTYQDSSIDLYVGPGAYKVTGSEPIDVAAYLKLLGESLTIIGQRLKEQEGQITVSGSIPLLLDSLLCALGPLICLTQQVPEINGAKQEDLTKTLENVAYIMPGL